MTTTRLLARVGGSGRPSPAASEDACGTGPAPAGERRLLNATTGHPNPARDSARKTAARAHPRLETTRGSWRLPLAVFCGCLRSASPRRLLPAVLVLAGGAGVGPPLLALELLG